MHVPEHLPVDHIGCGECGKWLAMQRRVGDHYSDLGRIADSRKRDVQLTVGKYRGRQVDCDLLEGLSLGFVDGHGEGGPYRVLPSAEDEGDALGVVVGVHVDPRKADNLTDVAPRDNLRLEDASGKVHDDQPCPVGKALCRVDVPQQDDWDADFQPQLVRRKAP